MADGQSTTPWRCEVPSHTHIDNPWGPTCRPDSLLHPAAARAHRERAMTRDETLSQFEVQTDPFTAAELATIADYRKAINGIGGPGRGHPAAGPHPLGPA